MSMNTSLLTLANVVALLVLGAGAVVAQSDFDVIEVDAQGKAKFRKEQTRPVQMGTSGGSAKDRTLFTDSVACCSGTLGALIEKNGKLHVLSNNHVLARINKGRKGEAIVQPGYLDQRPICQVPPDDETIAHLRAWKKIRFGSNKRNRVDAAIAEIVPGAVDPTGRLLKIGVPGSVPVDPAIGMRVKKVGRTSGLTRGMIISTDVVANVTFETRCGNEIEKTARFIDQIAIVSNNNRDFSKGGDSGSMIYRDVNNCPAPVGLLFAGSGDITVANPIKQVQKELAARAPAGPIEFVGCAPSSAEVAGEVEALSQDASQILMEDPEIKTAQRVLARQSRSLMQAPSVFGLGVGLASTGPAEAVVHVFADRTRPESWSEIPAEIEGVRTEIVPTGPFVAYCSNAGLSPAAESSSTGLETADPTVSAPPEEQTRSGH